MSEPEAPKPDLVAPNPVSPANPGQGDSDGGNGLENGNEADPVKHGPASPTPLPGSDTMVSVGEYYLFVR